MSTTSIPATVSNDTIAHLEINAAIDTLAARMTTEYTPIWDVSDFLLDAASAVSADPLAVAEIHQLHAELAPSSQRSVIKTADTREIVAKVRRIGGLAD